MLRLPKILSKLHPRAEGTHTVRCPDSRCRWTITTTQNHAGEAVTKHLAVDARHTGGAWVDLEGRERVGFNYAEDESRRMKRMTVGELIAQLSELDPDMTVLYHDYDGRSALVPLDVAFAVHAPKDSEDLWEWEYLPHDDDYTERALVFRAATEERVGFDYTTQKTRRIDG